MNFGKVSFNPNAFVGWTKTKFKKQYKSKAILMRPFSLDEVWDKLKKEIPKK